MFLFIVHFSLTFVDNLLCFFLLPTYTAMFLLVAHLSLTFVNNILFLFLLPTYTAMFLFIVHLNLTFVFFSKYFKLSLTHYSTFLLIEYLSLTFFNNLLMFFTTYLYSDVPINRTPQSHILQQSPDSFFSNYSIFSPYTIQRCSY